MMVSVEVQMFDSQCEVLQESEKDGKCHSDPADQIQPFQARATTWRTLRSACTLTNITNPPSAGYKKTARQKNHCPEYISKLENLPTTKIFT